MKTGKNDDRPDILSISTSHLLSKHFGYQGTIVCSRVWYEKKLICSLIEKKNTCISDIAALPKCEVFKKISSNHIFAFLMNFFEFWRLLIG